MRAIAAGNARAAALPHFGKVTSASPRVALIMDHPQRDLPGLVLVALRLCQAGVTTYLVPMNLASGEIWKLVPDFVLVNYLREDNQRLPAELMAAGVAVGVLDTEGGLFDRLEDLGELLIRDPLIRAQLRCYCCWGPDVADYLVEKQWFDASQVVVTGTPRNDFYTPRWRPAALRMSEVAEPYARNLVLINSNFPQGNPGLQSPEEQFQEMVRVRGMSPDEARRIQEMDGESICQFAALAGRLAQRFPQATFVYRPHPFENLDTYRKLLPPLPNLHVLREGTVEGWLIRARALIQSACSTAVEAWLAGAPALKPAWIPVWRKVPAAEQASLACSSEAELAAVLERLFREDSVESTGTQMQELIARWFYDMDGRAHERVAETILSRLPAAGQRQRWNECRRRVYGLSSHRRTSIRWLKSQLRARLGLPPHWSLRQRKSRPQPQLDSWDRSSKAFDLPLVQRLVVAMTSCFSDDESMPVEVSSVAGDNCFGVAEGRSICLRPRMNVAGRQVA